MAVATKAGGGGVVEAVRAAVGRPSVELGPVAWAPVAPTGNMTTERLDRVTGALADGTPFSVVAKVLRPAWASPVWQHIPEAFHAEVLATLHWLDEPHLYRCGLADGLPPGLRMPRLLAVEEGPERVVLWLEDVPDVAPWDLDRYRRSAVALGRLAGRWPGTRATAQLRLGRRPLRSMFFGKVLHEDVPAMAEDAFWADPAVAGAVDAAHRADVARLVDAAPGLLDRRDALPVGLCHGDACPANLLEPGDGSVVAIDWSYGNVGPIGSDLGQLLAGRFESGDAEPADLPAIAAAVLDGYAEGLAAEACEVDPTDVERAFAIDLAVRSGFSALVLGPGAAVPDDRRHDLLRRRAALGRFAVDLALRHAGA